MGKPDRRETERLIARDDGDPDATIYIPTTGRNNRARYHDDPGCSRLAHAHEVERWSRKKAKRWNRPPCKHCVLEDVERVSEPRPSLRDQLANGDAEGGGRNG
jgi:hypothetical protein